ncbi:MAG: IS21 family transposase [Planctomycetes bacterium]|nr:IS21 family transposase [Planctomycetota bacterium]MCW8137753.1 IS21 family transposase [Planctomycetota bacterium]
MARRRVETDRLRELVRLRRTGASKRTIARALRMGSNTVRRYARVLDAAGLLDGPPAELPAAGQIHAAVVAALGPEGGHPRAASRFAPRREEVETLLAKGLGGRAIFDRLRLSDAPPPAGSYSGLKRFVRQLRRERDGAANVAIPVDTAPCEVAQVDLGYAGKLLDPERGVLRRAWVFALVAAHSRFLFAKIVFEQDVETWVRLHEEAFAALGGVVSTVVPDNTRRAVLRAAFAIDGPTELNRSYRELAERYGFRIEPAPPGSPSTRGKVEAAIKHLRNNVLNARDGEPLDQVQADLQRWTREIANTRVHGTTKRRPIDVFEAEEAPALCPLPTAPVEVGVWRKARVHPDSHLAYRERLYSVPWQLVGEKVWVRGTRARVEVFHGDRRVAAHARTTRWRTTEDAHLPPDRRELRHRGRALWEARAARIGPKTAALARVIFDADPVLSHLRQVQAVVTHLERHPRRRAEAVAHLALSTGDYSYRAVRQALAEGLDLRAEGA